MGSYRIGVDVGGTFTDFLLVDEKGKFEVYKVLSTPENLSTGMLNGLEEMAQKHGFAPAEFLSKVELIVHGTTITTNALLTGNGAKTGLLTTKGFRDILQMRRGYKEELYNNDYTAPPPLVPRYRIHPLGERTDYKGEVVTAVRDHDIVGAIEMFREEEVEAVAICFLNSYANPENEKKAHQIVERDLPHTYVTSSYQLLPQIRLYDRISTTVLNSYVGLKLKEYLDSLLSRLEASGFRGVLLIMQSNGGVTTPQVAVKQASFTLLSGPAAGPTSGITFSRVHKFRDCITIDMGGTSFDVCLVKNQTPTVTTEGWVNRYRIGAPILDIHTIGAGGGSIGWVDAGGVLHMGPQSAGAMPGPASYGFGGQEPTCTDADLILGYLNKDYFFGGRIPLSFEAAAEAIQSRIGDVLNINLTEAAVGMHRLINVNMAAGIREISVKRGLDPRDFPLVVAGGAGPIHAGMIALELEIPLIIIPRQSSIFCALGMLFSDFKHDYVRTYHGLLSQLSLKNLQELFGEMEQEGKHLLRSEGIAEGAIAFQYFCEMRYEDQFHEIRCEVKREHVTSGDIRAIASEFHRNHDRLYGYHTPEREIEVLNLRLTAIGSTPKARFPKMKKVGEDTAKAVKGKRQVYLADKQTFASVKVYNGELLQYGNQIKGPAIVELPHTTVFVPSAFQLHCDQIGSYVMVLKKRAAEVFKLGR